MCAEPHTVSINDSQIRRMTNKCSMHNLNNCIKYPLKKRKRYILAAVCCVLLVYEGMELLCLRDNYSPLQLLSSIENEASRLLKFISQTQVHCNNSIATSNASTWMLCQEMELNLASQDRSAIVYSIGPSPDYSFEYFVSRNMSSRLYIFSHMADKLELLLKHSPSSTYIFKTTIVPNDPADFSRNSFDTQTVNSAMTNLKHSVIDILKIDTLIDTVHLYELLHFLIADSLILKVKELHFILKLDQVDGDYIYSWYRVLYGLFHEAGFRLYHTTTSDPLCLQDTIMESCRYFLSWIHRPPPTVFIMYPPAIDGSYEYEYERILSHLADTSSSGELSIKFNLDLLYKQSKSSHKSRALSIDLSQDIFNKNTQSCTVLCVLSSHYQHYSYQSSNQTSTKCLSHLFVYSPTSSSNLPPLKQLPLVTGLPEHVELVTLAHLQQVLTTSSSNVLYVDLDQAWDLIGWLSSKGVPQLVDQLIIKTSVLSAHGQQGQPGLLLRQRYSELRRLQEFQLVLVGSHRGTNKEQATPTDQDIFTLDYVKKVLL